MIRLCSPAATWLNIILSTIWIAFKNFGGWFANLILLLLTMSLRSVLWIKHMMFTHTPSQHKQQVLIRGKKKSREARLVFASMFLFSRKKWWEHTHFISSCQFSAICYTLDVRQYILQESVRHRNITLRIPIRAKVQFYCKWSLLVTSVSPGLDYIEWNAHWRKESLSFINDVFWKFIVLFSHLITYLKHKPVFPSFSWIFISHKL